MEILFEDDEIIVVKKDALMAVETKKIMEEDMVLRLKNHIYQISGEQKEPYLGIVHRLDQPVEGVMVFAKTPKAASLLSSQIRDGRMKKYYLAVTQGILETQKGICSDFILMDSKKNRSRIARKEEKNAKKAILKYELWKTLSGKNAEDTKNLVRIELITGRHHQIRLQMSHLGCPLWNDVKYGFQGEKTGNSIALCAYRLSFEYGKSLERVEYQICPSGDVFQNFSDVLAEKGLKIKKKQSEN